MLRYVSDRIDGAAYFKMFVLRYLFNIDLYIFDKINLPTYLPTTDRPTYLALFCSSDSSGMPRCTRIPRFILAGSRDQFEMPMKETFL